MNAKKTVRELREERGWTQVELGNRSGVHSVSISRIESGHSTPTVRNLRRLAEAFDVSADSIELLTVAVA